MTVEVSLNDLNINWKPKSINKMLRFLRFMKFHLFQYKLWLRQMLFRYKQMKLLKKVNNGHARKPSNGSQGRSSMSSKP